MDREEYQGKIREELQRRYVALEEDIKFMRLLGQNNSSSREITKLDYLNALSLNRKLIMFYGALCFYRESTGEEELIELERELEAEFNLVDDLIANRLRERDEYEKRVSGISDKLKRINGVFKALGSQNA